MRRAHFVPPNHSSETVHDAIVVDTETTPTLQADGSERHHLNFGFAASLRRRGPARWDEPTWCRFETPSEFWDWVETRLHGKCRLFIFAHNWSFDGPVLNFFAELLGRGWKLGLAVIESPPLILRWRRGKQSIVIVDTLNIWRMPLAAIGERLGIAKLPMPAPAAPCEEWDTYCRRDVEVLIAALRSWWELLERCDLGGFAPTLASQSMRAFRHRFMHTKILADADERALTLARSALHGGRTECFRLGRIPHKVFVHDVNSQYPSIMRRENLPTILRGLYKNRSIEWLGQVIADSCVVAECSIDTPVPAYAVVHEGRLVFPTGRFTTVLTTPEVRHALEHGHIRSVKQVAVYDRAIVFAEFVDYFYRLRMECRERGDVVGDWLAKIIMNSLYGKFAQKAPQWERFGECADPDMQSWVEVHAQTGVVSRYRRYAGIVETKVGESESRDSHPALAAHITAYARMGLWKLIEVAGRGNVVYCDTDSLWTNRAGHERLREFISPGELGMLKLERIADRCIIRACKDYVLDGTVKIKGVRKSAVMLHEGVYQQARFSSLKGALARGDSGGPVVGKVTKTLARIYRKGKAGPFGRVSPLLLH